MIRRFALRALCPVAPLLAVACASKGPHPDGTAVVTVVDYDGNPIGGVPIVSTAKGRVLGRAITGAGGTAELPVVSGGEVTGAKERAPLDFILTTVEGVHPGTVEVPMAASVPPAVTVPVSVLVLGTGGGYANVTAGRCENTVALTGTAATLQLSPDCTHGDGTFSVSAEKAIIVVLAPGYPTGYALDVPIGDVAVVSLVASTSSSVVPVPWLLTNIPTGEGVTVTHAPMHRGLRLGPGEYVYLNSPPSSASGSFDVPSSALADGSEMQIDLYDSGFADRSSQLRVRQSGPGPVALDASLIPPFAGVLFHSGTREITLTDAAASVHDTHLSVFWQDGDSHTHTWTIYAPPPAEAGTRKLLFPPLPDDLGFFAKDLYAPMSLYTVCAGYQAPPQPDFQAQPVLDLPANDGFVSRSQVCHLQ